MKPYIEYKGKTYEFEADFLLDKEFKRTIQKEQEKAMSRALAKKVEESGLSEEEIKQLENDTRFVKEYISKNPKIDNASDLPIEVLEKLGNMSFLFDELDLIPIYQEFCYKMLKNKYDITRPMWKDMLEQYYEEYCEDYNELYELFNRVIELVFTDTASQKLEKTKKKPKMDWLN